MTALTDLEFRVWDTYRWAADDFGVMPKSAAKLRGENDALREQHTEEEVGTALQKAIEIGLLVEFDHQGAMYVCSLTWNEHQKIEHPRQTHLPVPPTEVLDQMDVTTRRLFRNFRRKSPKPAPSRARATRETANGKRLTANGKEEHGNGIPSAPDLVSLWNQLVTPPIPQVTKLTADRARKITARLQVYPDLGTWRTVIAWINTQDWMRAQGTGDHPNWTATLDWLCKSDGQVAKYLERAVTPDGVKPTPVSRRPAWAQGGES